MTFIMCGRNVFQHSAPWCHYLCVGATCFITVHRDQSTPRCTLKYSALYLKVLGLELKPIPNLIKFWSESDNFSVVFHRVPRFRPMSTNRSQFIKNLSFFIRLETPGRSRHEKVIPDRNYHIFQPPVRIWLPSWDHDRLHIELSSILTVIFCS